MSSDHNHQCIDENKCCDDHMQLCDYIRKTYTICKKSICKKYNKNVPIDKLTAIKLNVVCMMSNPIKYKRRVELAKKFIKRMKLRNDVELYIAEIAYGDHIFEITEKCNLNHLQVRATHPLWHKENAINMACNTLLPKDWKNFCWIDMDIIFENKHWVEDALEILKDPKPIFVQLFSHAVDMDYDESAMSIFQSFAYQHSMNRPHAVTNKGFNYWHPGYAWGMNREAYDIVGGLYELSIIGSGDYNMAMSLINKGKLSIDSRTSDGYKKSIEDYQKKIQDNGILLKHISGVIRHEYHGSKVNRKYVQRNDIIIDSKYDPRVHLKHRGDGLLVPSEDCPKGLLDSVILYFYQRNEDENFL